MNILLAGGTGFIGSHLVHDFEKQTDHIYILTRHKQKDYANVHFIEWLQENEPLPNLSSYKIDAVINLAGTSLSEGRWTAERKREIVTSRITATSALIAMLKKLEEKPQVLLNASAIGIYPPSRSAIYLDTEVCEKDYDFLGRTVIEWEKTASELTHYGMRIVYLRFGMILGTDGGSFPMFEKTFQSFLGGRYGSGKQWYSWIHIDDVVRAVKFILQTPELSGGINLTAPHPVQQKKFADMLAKRLHRPSKLPIPKAALRLALGEKAQLVLTGQRAYPEKLLSHHFEFQFPTLSDALDDLLE
ncbi:TIGR01777 family oxidoreductase [Listeria ilorinensis]|uniref:TIGR01777 family oxidoreductase n=1 Tax=Listeria ilorinensis TaxID=2867439 RepID=UPI001EF57A1C|nr:TIGR01777 family oxidoreductase [Listeria ilorinensis]